MAGEPLTPAQVLELIPHREPFRFVDELLSVDEKGAVGRYTFRRDEVFYRGHFPQFAITPGVILLETMCQVGVLCHGIYLASLEHSLEELRSMVTLFTDAESIELLKPVLPGERVTCHSEKVFWRFRKLKARISMYKDDGSLAAIATASGMAVPRPEGLA